jgi:hypothetical protein
MVGARIPGNPDARISKFKPQLKGRTMDKVTRYEWQGSGVLLVLLCLLGITIPLAVVYFMGNLLRIETQVKDGEELAEFLRRRH